MIFKDSFFFFFFKKKKFLVQVNTLFSSKDVSKTFSILNIILKQAFRGLNSKSISNESNYVFTHKYISMI